MTSVVTDLIGRQVTVKNRGPYVDIKPHPVAHGTVRAVGISGGTFIVLIEIDDRHSTYRDYYPPGSLAQFALNADGSNIIEPDKEPSHG